MTKWIVAILITGCAVAAAGCGTKQCDCITPGDYRYTPADLPSPLVEVTADSPCVAQLLPVDGGPPQVEVSDVAATEGSVCVLHGRLADGRTTTATVAYGKNIGSCCTYFVASGGQFAVSDAGTSGG